MRRMVRMIRVASCQSFEHRHWMLQTAPITGLALALRLFTEWFRDLGVGRDQQPRTARVMARFLSLETPSGVRSSSRRSGIHVGGRARSLCSGDIHRHLFNDGSLSIYDAAGKHCACRHRSLTVRLARLFAQGVEPMVSRRRPHSDPV